MTKNSPSVLSVAEAIQLLTEQASKIVAEAQDVQQSDLVGHAWLAAHDLLQNRTKPEAAVYAWKMPIYLRRVIGEISALEGQEDDLPIDGDLIQPSLSAPFEEVVLAGNVRKVVNQALLKLTAREERCIRLCFSIGNHVELYLQQYGLDAENDDGGLKSSIVASEYSVTYSQVITIERKALRKLKHPSRLLRKCLESNSEIRDERQNRTILNSIAGFEHAQNKPKIETASRTDGKRPSHLRAPPMALGVYLGPIAPREMPKPPTAPEAVDMREMFSLFTTAGLATAGQFTFPQN